MDDIKITLSKVEDAQDLPIPEYMTSSAAGMDLAANVLGETCILPGEFKLISCGIKIEIPSGFEGQIRPRSGLAAKHGVTVLNSPGTIDSDYRGEIKVILINHGKNEFVVKRGDRIAQLVFSKVRRAQIREAENLKDTLRGEGGFGHTGI